MPSPLEHLNVWLAENDYAEAIQDTKNHFTSFSAEKGILSIRIINRKSYQPHVNCVNRDNFVLHQAVKRERGFTKLIYVVTLQGNGLQLIIPEAVVENYISNIWFVVPLKNAAPGQPPLPGTTARLI